jgi:hypothetical protein
MDRLETIPDIRQGPGHDGGKGIGEVSLAKGIGERRILNNRLDFRFGHGE